MCSKKDKNKKTLLGVAALCARTRTSLHTSPILWTDCPSPISLFGSHPCPKHPPQSHFYTCGTFRRQKTILTRRKPLTPRTVCPSVCLSACRPTWLSVSSSASLSIYLFVSVVCFPSFCRPLSVCISICFFVCNGTTGNWQTSVDMQPSIIGNWK